MEAPVRSVDVDGFWMDTKAVTAAEYRRFVRATGYVRVAERPLDAAEYPDADPELLVRGRSCFGRRPARRRSTMLRNWWEYMPEVAEISGAPESFFECCLPEGRRQRTLFASRSPVST